MGWRLKHVNRLFVGCSMSQQYTSVSQGRICSDKFMCCHTEIEVADQNFPSHSVTVHWPTSPSTHLITPGAWQGSHWSANFYVSAIDLNPRSSALQADALTIRPMRWFQTERWEEGRTEMTKQIPQAIHTLTAYGSNDIMCPWFNNWILLYSSISRTELQSTIFFFEVSSV